MPKPIMNLDEVAFDDIEENGKYTSSRGQISDHIGARQLGYNLTVVPPESIALWQGTPTNVPGGTNTTGAEEVPQSFWKYLLAALLGVALAESILANRFAAAAEDEKREVRKLAA